MTSLKVIIGKIRFFGTYVETICFSENFTNEDEKTNVIKNAKLCVYDYAESFGCVYLNTIHNEKLNSDEEVFKFLENSK